MNANAPSPDKELFRARRNAERFSGDFNAGAAERSNLDLWISPARAYVLANYSQRDVSLSEW